MRYIIIPFFVALCHVAFSQIHSRIGARPNGLAYASSCLYDEWAIFNNPAGASMLKDHTISTSYEVVPGFTPWNRSAVAAVIPLKTGTVNAGLFRFGDQLYSEQMIAASWSNKFGISCLGASVQYIQYNGEGIGTKGVASFSLGGITEFSETLRVGAYIINGVQPETAEGEKLATLLALGVSFEASPKVDVFVEIEKSIEESATLKAAVEYRFSDKFCLRSGFHPAPAAGFFGFGFRRSQLKADYAFSYLPDTGSRHQAGLSYIIRKRR